MVKEKIHNDFSEMKLKQSIEMVKELFSKIDLNDSNSIFFRDLIEVMQREEKSYAKVLKRWNIVKDTLTRKQLMPI